MYACSYLAAHLSADGILCLTNGEHAVLDNDARLYALAL